MSISLTRTTPGATSDANANLNNNWTLLEALLNGDLDTTNLDAAAGITAAQLAAAVRDALGLNDGTSVRRGKSIIATEEGRTNVAYGLLTTPDRVSNIVLPTDGLLVIRYQAMWRESVAGAARAAIFIGANQLKIATSAANPVTQAAATGALTPSVFHPLASSAIGLVSNANTYTAHVTTGQIVGLAAQGNPSNIAHELDGAPANVVVNDSVPSFGLAGDLVVFAAAGTYDISVQFKASSGAVDGAARKLWVEAIGF